MMNKKTYEQWWQLHLRISKGEQVTDQEQEEYQTGLEMLDKVEEYKLLTDNPPAI